eukprot:Hpha_TRINITY_DN13096_c0_g1::TRINITY_DN13096_c0_g1_i1::g.68924::m.68924
MGKFPVGNPGCSGRCRRVTWKAWDKYHQNEKADCLHIPPQYVVSPVERAIFKYTFWDTFDGGMSKSEWIGVAVCVGGMLVNLGSIFQNAFALQFGTPKFEHYQGLVKVTIAFEFAYFVAYLTKWIYVLAVRSKLDDEHTSRILFYRQAVKACNQLGELNAFSLLQYLRADVLGVTYTQIMRMAQKQKGRKGHVVLVLGCTGVLVCALFAVAAILAKLALVEFVFDRGPLEWSLSDILAASGFLNNLLRRDRSENQRIKILEYCAAGHFLP